MPDDPNELLGVQQVARLLGVDRTTVSRLPLEPAETTGGGSERAGRSKYRRRDVEAYKAARDDAKREPRAAVLIARLQGQVVALRAEVADLRGRLDLHEMGHP